MRNQVDWPAKICEVAQQSDRLAEVFPDEGADFHCFLYYYLHLLSRRQTAYGVMEAYCEAVAHLYYPEFATSVPASVPDLFSLPHDEKERYASLFPRVARVLFGVDLAVGLIGLFETFNARVAATVAEFHGRRNATAQASSS